jgi:uncharacterized protein (DUF1697 family)
LIRRPRLQLGLVETWAVLLRGINVGGRNVIPMASLRSEFSAMGFREPQTYIQTGNVLVGSTRKRSTSAVTRIERHLSQAFGYDARVVVRDAEAMAAIVEAMPSAWDPEDRSVRHNVIFFTDHAAPEHLTEGLVLDPAIESVATGPHAVYWSAPMSTLTRTKMIKLSANPLYQEVTIRNARVTLKLAELLRERNATT